MDEASYKQMDQQGPKAYAAPVPVATTYAVATEAPPLQQQQYVPEAVPVEVQPGAQVVTVVYVAEAPQPEKMGFVRKVFTTLTVQLIITFAIVLAFFIPGCPISNDTAVNCSATSVRQTVYESTWIFWVVFVAWIVLYIACVCTQPRCRKAPANYIILSTFTLGTGVFLGVLSCYSTLVEVLIAIALTVFIAVSIIGLTCCSFMRGFVGPAPYVAVIIISIFWTSLLFIPVGVGFTWYTYYNVLWSGLGVIIFSLFIIWDTCKILSGGHRRYRFGMGDHCTAALSLYLDIVNLFICLLSGGRR